MIAILGGWVSIAVGAFLGLARSDFLGMSNSAGPQPLLTVYGFSGAIVLWLFVAAALLAALPVGMTMLAPDARSATDTAAVIMAAAGLVLLPDELGRAFGLPLLPGSALLAFGGWLIARDATSPDLEAGGVTSGIVAAPGEGPEPRTAEPVPPAAYRGTPPEPSASDRECPWCSARVPAGVSTCPACKAKVDGDTSVEAVRLPGLTEVSPSLRAYAERVRIGKPRRSLRTLLLGQPSTPVPPIVPDASEPDALRPPNEAVRAEMARLDEEIAARAVLPGTDPFEIPAGFVSPEDAPSPEAAPSPETPPRASGTPEAAPAPEAASVPAPLQRRKPKA